MEDKTKTTTQRACCEHRQKTVSYRQNLAIFLSPTFFPHDKSSSHLWWLKKVPEHPLQTIHDVVQLSHSYDCESIVFSIFERHGREVNGAEVSVHVPSAAKLRVFFRGYPS